MRRKLTGVRVWLVATWVAAALILGPIGLYGLFGVLLRASEDTPIWSTDVRSPDGEWDAVALTFPYTWSGGSPLTVVRIERGKVLGWTSSTVFSVWDNGPRMGLTMKWQTPKHLLISFKADPGRIIYEAATSSGIVISRENEYRPADEPRLDSTP